MVSTRGPATRVLGIGRILCGLVALSALSLLVLAAPASADPLQDATQSASAIPSPPVNAAVQNAVNAESSLSVAPVLSQVGTLPAVDPTQLGRVFGLTGLLPTSVTTGGLPAAGADAQAKAGHPALRPLKLTPVMFLTASRASRPPYVDPGVLHVKVGPFDMQRDSAPLALFLVLLAAAGLFLVVQGRIDRRARAAVPADASAKPLDFE